MNLSPKFWMPDVLIDAATRLHAQLANEGNTVALQILFRLSCDERMKRVWREIYKKRRSGDKPSAEFFYPACATPRSRAARLIRQAIEARNRGNESEAKLREILAKGQESLIDNSVEAKPEQVGTSASPIWSEQDIGAQKFFVAACLSAIDIEPVFSAIFESERKKLETISAALKMVAKELGELGRESDAADLITMAEQYDEEVIMREENETDPRIIQRQRNDSNIRTYAVELTSLARDIFGDPMRGTVATIANVVFKRNDLTGVKVREWSPTPEVSDLDL